MKKNHNFFFILLFSFFFLAIFWKIFLGGHVIGPFDFLNAFYDPYRSIEWKNPESLNSVRHYKNLLLADVVTVVWPQKLLAIDLFKSGKFPLWNPYMLSGTPLLANIQSSVLYPLNLLFFIFNKVGAFNIYVLSQFVMAYSFMYLFLKRMFKDSTGLPRPRETRPRNDNYFAFFGAMSFAFCSFMVGWGAWGTLGHAILWLPLILYFIDKYFETKNLFYGCLISICLTFSFFAGHTQTTTMVYLISFIYVVVKSFCHCEERRDAAIPLKTALRRGSFWFDKLTIRMTFSLLGFMLLSLLLGSIQLIPAIEMYMNSARELVSSPDFYTDQTLYFSSYLAGLFPDIFGNPVTRNWWGKMNYVEAAIYFGTTSFYFMIYGLLSFWNERSNPLFVIARSNRKSDEAIPLKSTKTEMPTTFALILIVLGIILSTQNPISKLIFDLKVPLFSSNTFARYSMIYIFGGIVLSTIGFSQLIVDIKSKHFKMVNFNNLIFVTFIGFFGILILFKLLPEDYVSNISIIKRNIIIPIAILTTLIFSTFFYTKKNLRIEYLDFLVIILLLVELYRFTNKFLPIVPAELFFPNHKSINKLREFTKDGRYYGYLANNTNVMHKVSSFTGGEPLYNKNLAEIAGLSKSNIPEVKNRGGLEVYDGPNKYRVLDLLSVKYFADGGDTWRNTVIGSDFGGSNEAFDQRFKVIWHEDNYNIYINNFALEKERLYYSYTVPKNNQEMFDRLVDKKFDISKNVFLEKSIGQFSAGKSGSIKKISETETEKKYFVDSASGVLVLSDIYYPGWRVYIDGEEQELLKANNTFMAVKTREGKNNVQFIYNSNTLKFATTISFIGFYILSFLIVFGLVNLTPLKYKLKFKK